MSWYTGAALAELLLAEAASHLPTPIFNSLCEFIAGLQQPNAQNNRQQLQQILSASFNAFRNAEMRLTFEDDSTMSAPSGRPDAFLCIIMHCQSKEGIVDQFWDPENQSIQVLERKGVKRDSIFGYDWHWRAEGPARKRAGNCPTSKWSKEKVELHNEFSHHLLDILPFRLVVIASACARKHYRNRLNPHTTYRLTVLLENKVEIEFSVEVQEAKVQRITAFADHPAAGFFQPTRGPEVCTRLDATLNLFLHLLNIPHQEFSCTDRQNSHCRGVPGAAPLKELCQYVKQEEDYARALYAHEFDQGVLSWARKFLKDRDVDKMLEQGESVAQAARLQFQALAAASFQDPRRKNAHADHNRNINADRYGNEIEEFWDGQEVRWDRKGIVRLYVPGRPAYQFLIPAPVIRKYLNNGSAKPTITFSSNGISLSLGKKVLYEVSRAKLRNRPTFGEAGIKHLDRELAYKTRGCKSQLTENSSPSPEREM